MYIYIFFKLGYNLGETWANKMENALKGRIFSPNSGGFFFFSKLNYILFWNQFEILCVCIYIYIYK